MTTLSDELRRCPHLADLEPQELETLARAMQVCEASDGHVFLREGDKPDGCFVVVSGRVRVTHVVEDRAVELASVGPGEIFGLVSLIDHRPRTATCRADGDVRAAWLPESAFTLLHEGSPSLVLHFQSLVARQLARDTRALNEALVRAMLSQLHGQPGAFSGEFHVTVAR